MIGTPSLPVSEARPASGGKTAVGRLFVLARRLEKLGVRVVTDVKVETVDDKGVIAQGVEDQ
jgi:hypothetical protein